MAIHLLRMVADWDRRRQRTEDQTLVSEEAAVILHDTDLFWRPHFRVADDQNVTLGREMEPDTIRCPSCCKKPERQQEIPHKGPLTVKYSGNKSSTVVDILVFAVQWRWQSLVENTDNLLRSPCTLGGHHCRLRIPRRYIFLFDECRRLAGLVVHLEDSSHRLMVSSQATRHACRNQRPGSWPSTSYYQGARSSL